MAMSDCPKCWNTPCTCGYMGYKLFDTTNEEVVKTFVIKVEEFLAAVRREDEARLENIFRENTRTERVFAEAVVARHATARELSEALKAFELRGHFVTSLQV